MISTWMQDEKTDKWSERLRFIQLMKNRALHFGIKKSPYEALFGCKAKAGLTTSSLPQDVLKHIQSEEELEKLSENIEIMEKNTTEAKQQNRQAVPQQQPSTSDVCCVCSKEASGPWRLWLKCSPTLWTSSER